MSIFVSRKKSSPREFAKHENQNAENIVRNKGLTFLWPEKFINFLWFDVENVFQHPQSSGSASSIWPEDKLRNMITNIRQLARFLVNRYISFASFFLLEIEKIASGWSRLMLVFLQVYKQISWNGFEIIFIRYQLTFSASLRNLRRRSTLVRQHVSWNFMNFPDY